MKYNAHQKVYFQMQTVLSILEENDAEIYDMEMDGQVDEAKDLLKEISDEAYRKASESEQDD